MKIAVVLAEVERWSSYYGGALARYTYEMLKNQPKGNFNVTVFGQSCDSKFKYPYALIEPGNFFIKLDSVATKTRTGFAGWAYILPIYNELKKNDIIHIHNRPFYALIIRKLGYKGKIITHLNNDFGKSSKGYAKRFIDASDVVVSCSQKIADLLFEKYPEGASKSRILYNGADEEKFTYGRFHKRKKQILFVGRIDEIKGVHNLLNAFDKLLFEFPDWNLVLAGSASFGAKNKLTEYEQSIKSKIEQINNKFPNRIEHKGYVDHSKLPDLFKESRIFCLPSVVHDAFPFVVIESMFTGTPVVGSNMGGIPEALGNIGTLAEPNIDSLYFNLKLSMENPEKLESDGIKLFERAKENFSWKSIALKQHELYRELL